MEITSAAAAFPASAAASVCFAIAALYCVGAAHATATGTTRYAVYSVIRNAAGAAARI